LFFTLLNIKKGHVLMLSQNQVAQVFFTDAKNKYQTVKAEIKKRSGDLEIPHFSYSPKRTPVLPGNGGDVFTPTRKMNRNLNDSKPNFSNDKNDARKMAYIAKLKAEARKLKITPILDEAMSAKSRLHGSYSTNIPSMESLQYTAKARELALQKKIVFTNHSLARVLQDGEALTLIKAIKEFCENHPRSKTFLAYDQRKNLKTKKYYNQLHLFRPNSATKSAIQIPLSPPAPQAFNRPKGLKARTIIANTFENFDRKLKNGAFVILHTDEGMPINTNTLYQAERKLDAVCKNLFASPQEMELS
jgi:hypothetical protein